MPKNRPKMWKNVAKFFGGSHICQKITLAMFFHLKTFSFVCLFYGWFALKTGSSKYPNEKNFKWKNMANVIFWHMWDPPKILATFFQIFGLFLGIYPPCLWLYLKSFHAKHFKIIKYQCTIVTLTRWDWFWV